MNRMFPGHRLMKSAWDKWEAAIRTHSRVGLTGVSGHEEEENGVWP